MRDHFDPLAPLLQHHHRRPDSSHHVHMQGQTRNHDPSKVVGLSAFDAFGSGFSNTAAPSNHGAAGGKRSNIDENVDCNLLQSSLKRVRLSRSPGEFRLQRDLKTLDTMQWGSIHFAANALNFAATTWIHRSTGARLTMMDSLRVCFFLPMTAMQQNVQSSDNLDPQQQYQHQMHSYHRNYRWRMMIKFPRMYPHSPPVVTRVEGLSIEGIEIKEKPPGTASRDGEVNNESNLLPSIPSSQDVATSESIFYTETQLTRSSTENQKWKACDNAKTIKWHLWSPITGLGELLDFLSGVAASNPSTTRVNSMPSTSMMGTRCDAEASMVLTSAKMPSSSSSSLSSVSSASSISSWSNHHDTGRITSVMQKNANNDAVAEIMMSDESSTTNSNRTNISGESFLPPNRFDVGYGKPIVENRVFSNTIDTTPRTTNTSAWQQYREKQYSNDDVGMDMS
mmetsp:Transcript_11774/g.27942  ORF Transcript_11774/g.27942 Transcript_11774/m.27942 type:complete len:452 (-) Transcript_11774:181-1536(-)